MCPTCLYRLACAAAMQAKTSEDEWESQKTTLEGERNRLKTERQDAVKKLEKVHLHGRIAQACACRAS